MTTKYVQIVVDTKNSQAKTDALANSLDRVGNEADQTTSSLSKLSGVAQAVVSAIAASQIIKYADAWTTVNNKLANSIRAHETLADVTQRVFDIAQDTRTSLDATTTLYSRLERATRDYNVSAEQLTKLTTTINQGFIVSGATAQEAENAIIQLAQGLASGALRGEEFNSVNEQGNRIIVALADSLGKTTGEMRALAAEGKLTTDVVVNGLLKQSDVIANEFSKTIATFSQNTQTATTNLTKFVGESTLVQSTVAGVGDALVLASENLQLFADLATALAVVYVARLAPGVVAYTTSIYANIAASTKATIVTNAYGQVISRTTVAMNAAALATRAFSGALALIGGPAGAIVIAVAALASYIVTANDASEANERMRASTEKAKLEYSAFTKEMAQSELIKVEAELNEASKKMQEFKKQIDETAAAAGRNEIYALPGQIAQSKTQAADAARELESMASGVGELAAKANILQGIISRPTATAGTPSAAATGSTAATSSVSADYSARFIDQEQENTARLKEEYINRAALFDAFSQRIFDARNNQFVQERLLAEQERVARTDEANAELSDTLFDIEQKRALLIENDRIDAETRFQIQQEYDEQERIAQLDHEFALEQIAQEGANARQRIKEAEFQFNLQLAQSAANDLISIAQGQSRKAFEIGKAASITAAVVDGYSAAVAAWDAGMSTGGPWAPAVAAAYTAASVLKTGALINKIKSTQYNSSGTGSANVGGGLPSVSTGGSATPPGVPDAPGSNQSNLRTISIEGLEAGQKVTLDREMLIELLSNDDDVIISANNGQKSATRVGLI